MNKVHPVETRLALASQLNGLTKWFSRANTTLNDPESINELVEFIIKEYYWMKYEEIKIVFDMAKKGAFGKIYALDNGTIIEWINAYDANVRESKIEQMNKNMSQESSLQPLWNTREEYMEAARANVDPEPKPTPAQESFNNFKMKWILEQKKEDDKT